MKPQLQQVLRAVAAQQGRDPDELLAEMLRGQLPQQHRQLAPQQDYPVVAQQVEVLPPQHHYRPPPPAHRPQVQAHLPQRYAGVGNPQTEGDMEALARYLEAESGPQGVFGDGGMSAGGVFGGGTVATAGHDPSADIRTAHMALARAAPQLMQALAQRAEQPVYAHPPPPPPQPVRMVTHSTTTYYEGPAPPQFAPQHAPPPAPPQLPWPWGRR